MKRLRLLNIQDLTPPVAHALMGPGETEHFHFTPTSPGVQVLEVATQLKGWTVRVPLRVGSREAASEVMVKGQ